MKATLRETNLNENLQKYYSNDNILKLPISNTFDETDEIEIPTITRISIFSKDLKIDVKSVFNFMKNNEENLYS